MLFRHAATADGRGWRLGLAVTGFAGHQFAEVMVPVVVGLTIDRALAGDDPGALISCLVLLALVFTVLISAWQTGDRLITKVWAHSDHSLRQRTIGHTLLVSRSRRPPGEVLALASSDTSQVAGVAWIVTEQSAAFGALLVASSVLALWSWPLAVSVIAGTILQAWLVHRLSGRLRDRSHQTQERAARLDALGTDLVLGLRSLEALGATGEAARRYREESNRAAEAAYRADRAAAALTAVNAVAAGSSFAVVATLAGALALGGSITIGAAVTAIGLAQAVRGPLQTLGYLPGALAAKHGSARRLAEFLAEPVDPAGDPSAADAAGPAPMVEVHSSGVHFRTRPGWILGVRGGPEAKQLVDLLSLREPPRPGTLSLDGRDASTLPPTAVRRVVLAAPHDAALFSGTVADNLGLRPGCTQDPRTISSSGLAEVISRLPNGMDEEIGENGSRLSGGQRQRLVLARAMTADHPVLVLHEPTTAMDPVTEADVAAGLIDHVRRTGRCLVLVTDSPALLRICDEVHQGTSASQVIPATGYEVLDETVAGTGR